MGARMEGGLEWIVDVEGCDADCIAGEAGLARLRALFERVIEGLDLHPVARPIWHVFPETGGITGLVALSESHLACHSYPELGYLALSLYSCGSRVEPDWHGLAAEALGPCRISVRSLQRGGASVRPRKP